MNLLTFLFILSTLLWNVYGRLVINIIVKKGTDTLITDSGQDFDQLSDTITGLELAIANKTNTASVRLRLHHKDIDKLEITYTVGTLVHVFPSTDPATTVYQPH